MAARIVVFGATGYTGRLTAERLVADGQRPVLAGRSEPRLRELAERLGGLDWSLADVGDSASVRSLVDRGDVLVSTVGPFVRWGDAAARAAIAAGGVYVDSTGEPPFIRRVFDEFGPPAAVSGATLLTAMGYDFVPGTLAGALALRDAGPGAVRVDIGYYALGAGTGALSRGTRASLAGVALAPAFAFRDGGLRAVRSAERIRSFRVHGSDRPGVSVGGVEHFTLPLAFAAVREVNVYLGWFGPLSRGMQLTSRLTAAAGRVPGLSHALLAGAGRLAGLGPAPEAGTTGSTTSWVAAAAYDTAGEPLATVELTGGDPYAFTAGSLAWAARRAASDGVQATGAVGPIQAFGLNALEAGVAEAGIARAPAA